MRRKKWRKFYPFDGKNANKKGKREHRMRFFRNIATRIETHTSIFTFNK